jgi:hypothetical protein
MLFPRLFNTMFETISPAITVRPLLLALGLACALSGCRADHVVVNPKDPKTPQYAYRLDELALLQMAADDIQELERSKQYGKIYDDFGSTAFKAGLTRRRFLIMANCVETHLGGLQEFERNNTGFSRRFQQIANTKRKRSLDTLRREVDRSHLTIFEQMIFTTDGIHFKLNGLYWIAKSKPFLQCIADSPRLEAETTPLNYIEGQDGPIGKKNPNTPADALNKEGVEAPTSAGKPIDAGTGSTASDDPVGTPPTPVSETSGNASSGATHSNLPAGTLPEVSGKASEAKGESKESTKEKMSDVKAKASEKTKEEPVVVPRTVKASPSTGTSESTPAAAPRVKKSDSVVKPPVPSHSGETHAKPSTSLHSDAPTHPPIPE